MSERQTEPGLVIAREGEATANWQQAAALDALPTDEMTALAERALVAIRNGWMQGVPLHEIAAETGLHWRVVLDMVRRMKLPERCPVERLTVTAMQPGLPPELLAH